MTTRSGRGRARAGVVAPALALAMLVGADWQSGASAARADCVVVFGDSLADGLASAVGWARGATKGTTLRVINRGLGGQNVEQIAGRIGAQTVSVYVDPTAAPQGATVTLRSVTPNILGFSGTETSLDGAIAGQPGVLRWRRGAKYTFTPAAATPPTWQGSERLEFVPSDTATSSCFRVLWAGRNSIGSPEHIARTAGKITELWDRQNTNYVVLGIPNGDKEPRGSALYENIDHANALLRARYNGRFVDIRAILLDEARKMPALSDAGRDDLANDIIPRDLRRDNIHINSVANEILWRSICARSEISCKQT